ncbi:unnamed protein product [Prunus armeniaca]
MNGSEWVQVKKLVDEHDCGTVDHNFHANSTWLAQRYATQLSIKHNCDMGTFKQQGCRPVIGFDACHIKGHHPGQLLSVVGVDPNNGMYPIAYAVAEVEKGLVLKLQIEKIARSTTIPWWDVEMKNMRQLSQTAFDWVAALDPSQWCRAHFKTHSKCDILLNNMCEAFNGALVKVRDKPILTMLERIRYYIMLLMATRSASCEKWKHAIGPRIFGILEKTKKESAWCIPKLDGESLYEVKNHDGSQVVVD